MKKFKLFLFLVVASKIVFAQSKDDLKKEKKKIENEIKITNGLLEKTKQNKLKSLNYLNALSTQIEKEESLVKMLNIEIKLKERKIKNINKTILESKDVISNKEAELEMLMENYSKIIFSYSKNKGLKDQLMFIISSDDFNQAYKRLLYVKQYTTQRKNYSIQISKEQNELKQEINKLEVIKKELEENTIQKKTLYENKYENLNKISDKKTEKEQLISKLVKSEKYFKKELKEKQKKANELDEKIRKIIEEEIKKARELAEKANKLNLSPAALELTKKFAENKRKLPWPVETGVVIQKFGNKKHQIFSEVQTFNNGVDIVTEKKAKVNAIFDGKISRIFVVKGEGKAVLISHGKFYTVYSGLQDVVVETGEEVLTREKIGEVRYNEKEQRSLLHFEIWKGYDKVDPGDWIYKLY
ncbi:MAG: hypothetical protein CBC44_002675 [Flavobacteriales bacterium TMED84]|nr:MAG: hypothetical protein CBC44_002675 [Flavobacteriales bacterium TMED84]